MPNNLLKRESAMKVEFKKAAAKRTKGGIDATHVTAAQAAVIANHALMESYTFDKYKTGKKQATPAALEVYVQDPAAAEKEFVRLKNVTDGVFWASDLANEPGNVLNPQTYAADIASKLSPLGIKIRIISAQEMEKLGMGAALAVGRGSATPPCMVVMEYDGTNGAQDRPLALVGKGITFDSGGISLKPGAGMGDMTMDMGGSAAVVGAMYALAANKVPTKAVAIVALAENMPSGAAYRPGDIVTSMSGKTIYVGNTDAEGRLVLADALTYIQRNYNPHTVVDLATLTGAAVVALGKEFAAVYANDNKLWKKFNAASLASGEKVWRMPLTETDSFTRAVRNTPVADISNNVAGPGSCTAAAFLREFIEKDANGNDKCKWAHIDMAGPGIPATLRKGWGVQLLNSLVNNNYQTPKKPAPKP